MTGDQPGPTGATEPAETPMSAGPGPDLAGSDRRGDGPGSSSQRAGDRGVDPAAWRRVVLGLAVLGFVALAVVGIHTVRGSGRPPPATLLATTTGDLPEVPTSAVAERLTVDLGAGDRFALVDDLVVVVDESHPTPFEDQVVVRAHHLRQGRRVLWEQRVRDLGELVVVDPAGGISRAANEDRTSPPAAGGDLVALDATDGGVLWRRSADFAQPNAVTGLVAVSGGSPGCEVLDPRSGRTARALDASACLWLDERLAVRAGGRWRVVDPEGGDPVDFDVDQPPVAVDDLLVGVSRDGEVVARRSDGTSAWRRRTDLSEPWLEPLPGTGVVVQSFDDRDTGPQAIAIGPDGRRRPLPDGFEPNQSLAMEVSGRRLAVVFPPDDATTVEVRDLDRAGERLGRLESSVDAAPSSTVTARGLLVMADGRLTLHRWPTLEPAWSTNLPGELGRADGAADLQVVTSRAGVVVVDGRPEDGAVLHGFS